MYAAAVSKGINNGSSIDRPINGSFSRLKRPTSIRLRIPAGCKVDPKEVYDYCREIFNLTPVSLGKNTAGDIILTVKSSEEKKEVLKFAFLKVSSGHSLAIFDPEQDITFINVYNVPFELHDDALVRKLSKFGVVLSHRRGHHAEMPEVENGIRHFRMKLQARVPSFLHFGSESFFVRYQGQLSTCRRCNEPGHEANQCNKSRCFNCEETGHNISSCPEPPRCSICSSTDHTITSCPEWCSQVRNDDEPSEEESDTVPESEDETPEAIDSQPLPLPFSNPLPDSLQPPLKLSTLSAPEAPAPSTHEQSSASLVRISPPVINSSSKKIPAITKSHHLKKKTKLDIPTERSWKPIRRKRLFQTPPKFLL
eukprot:gene11673-biopygen9343